MDNIDTLKPLIKEQRELGDYIKARDLQELLSIIKDENKRKVKGLLN